MIGTHDSFTYLHPRRWWFIPFAFIWRTQKKDLQCQNACGVNYIDVRVRRTDSGWRLCHGLVDFDMEFDSLRKLLNAYQDYQVRLILERGSSFEFETIAPRLSEDFPNLSFMGVKRGWKVLVNRDMRLVDYTFKPWLSGVSFMDNVKRLLRMILEHEPMTIYSWSRKYNGQVTDDMKKDPDIIYFMDRV